mmetsp:Transcript_11853/g.35766  ORF Transcript_11853/g.35766 Transcript_11853/m.35766 type:complete len:259 (-) Transcript_11853:905-1681(-)
MRCPNWRGRRFCWRTMLVAPENLGERNRREPSRSRDPREEMLLKDVHGESVFGGCTTSVLVILLEPCELVLLRCSRLASYRPFTTISEPHSTGLAASGTSRPRRAHLSDMAGAGVKNGSKGWPTIIACVMSSAACLGMALSQENTIVTISFFARSLNTFTARIAAEGANLSSAPRIIRTLRGKMASCAIITCRSVSWSKAPRHSARWCSNWKSDTNLTRCSVRSCSDLYREGTLMRRIGSSRNSATVHLGRSAWIWET